MSQTIIDHLKPIDIEEEDCKQIIAVALGSLHGTAQTVHEKEPIGQTRQGIGHLVVRDVRERTSHTCRILILFQEQQAHARRPIDRIHRCAATDAHFPKKEFVLKDERRIRFLLCPDPGDEFVRTRLPGRFQSLPVCGLECLPIAAEK